MEALAWLLVSNALLFIHVVVLLSLRVVNNWKRCHSHDDCQLGSVCVKLRQ